MKMLKITFAAAVLMAISAPLAFAGGETPDSTFGENTMTFTKPDGSVAQKTITDAAMAKMMTDGATPMMVGHVMMMHGGKMYSMPDHMLSNGKMMSDMTIYNK
jgi:hypothetical protein